MTLGFEEKWGLTARLFQESHLAYFYYINFQALAALNHWNDSALSDVFLEVLSLKNYY